MEEGKRYKTKMERRSAFVPSYSQASGRVDTTPVISYGTDRPEDCE